VSIHYYDEEDKHRAEMRLARGEPARIRTAEELKAPPPWPMGDCPACVCGEPQRDFLIWRLLGTTAGQECCRCGRLYKRPGLEYVLPIDMFFGEAVERDVSGILGAI
jgi:hypothetical protein